MNLLEGGWKEPLRHFWDTRGRTGRVVFGTFIALFYGILYFVVVNEGSRAWHWILIPIAMLLTLVPAMRRFHDLNKPSTYMLLFFIPGINAITLLYLLLTPSVKGPNRWGE